MLQYINSFTLRVLLLFVFRQIPHSSARLMFVGSRSRRCRRRCSSRTSGSAGTASAPAPPPCAVSPWPVASVCPEPLARTPNAHSVGAGRARTRATPRLRDCRRAHAVDERLQPARRRQPAPCEHELVAPPRRAPQLDVERARRRSRRPHKAARGGPTTDSGGQRRRRRRRRRGRPYSR